MEKAVRENFEVHGVWLFCHVERGTFPQYYWFHNKRRLDKSQPFYTIFNLGDSGLVVSLYPDSGSAGFYHCEAVNSFDNTTRVSSPRTLISHEGNKILAI